MIKYRNRHCRGQESRGGEKVRVVSSPLLSYPHGCPAGLPGPIRAGLIPVPHPGWAGSVGNQLWMVGLSGLWWELPPICSAIASSSPSAPQRTQDQAGKHVTGNHDQLAVGCGVHWDVVFKLP